MSAESVQAIKAPPAAPTPAEKITAAQSQNAPREMAVDMFEQREFAETVQPDGKDDMPQNTALRGTLYKDSFIPPKPAEISEASPSGAAPYISSFHGEHVPQSSPQASHSEQASAPETASAPGLKLNPPKMPTPEQKKRSPSLFERISGTVQEHLEGIGGRPSHEGEPRQRMAPTAGGNAGLQPIAKNTGPSQGSLNIDSPSKPAPKSDENLDIPAFLRRQAN